MTEVDIAAEILIINVEEYSNYIKFILNFWD
jgi:hypothetical protein